MLQTTACMTLFEDGFRPWPHVYEPGHKSKFFYEGIDANLMENLTSLRTYTEREDSERYIDILREVFRLFGEGIIASLEYTMHDYLAQTNGALSNKEKDEWELEAVKGMLSHNNHAERPFAVLRAFAKMYLASLPHLPPTAAERLAVPDQQQQRILDQKIKNNNNKNKTKK
jgi:hypothetical protein